MRKYLYSEWDSTQEIFDPDEDELMDELGQELMSSGNVSDSLNQMQQEGIEDDQGRRLPGIEEMLEQLQQKRQSQTVQTHPSSENLSSGDEELPEDELESANDIDRLQ